MKYSTMKAGAPGFLVVAVLAFAVPAPAGVRPDDRSGLRGAGGASGSIQVRPDDRAGLRGPGADFQGDVSVAASLRPDDRAGLRGIVPAPRTIALGLQYPVPVERGFDWAAAGAGAGSGAAVVSFLAWALLLRRNHPRARSLA
jgi:hypothetical protein